MALNKGYTFISAVAMNKMHPDTFEIPTDADRHNLKPGDFAKLIFKPRMKDGITERMWVRVFKRMNKEGVYEGVLQNEPAYDLRGLLRLEDAILFRPEHVADIERKK